MKTKSINLIDRETAKQELNRWFDYRNVSEDNREELDENSNSDFMYERVLNVVMKGMLQFISETGELKYTLDSPLKKLESGEVLLNEIIFKPRYKRRELDQHLRGIKPNDIDMRTRAYMSAITGVTKDTLGELFNNDYDIVEAVYILFLRV